VYRFFEGVRVGIRYLPRLRVPEWTLVDFYGLPFPVRQNESIIKAIPKVGISRVFVKSKSYGPHGILLREPQHFGAIIWRVVLGFALLTPTYALIMVMRVAESKKERTVKRGEVI
jgi:hypothetical protein